LTGNGGAGSGVDAAAGFLLNATVKSFVKNAVSWLKEGVKAGGQEKTGKICP
jgi:hypothetical protein